MLIWISTSKKVNEMASNNLTYTIEVKDQNKIIETLANLVSDYNELVDLIPEWNNLEAKKICDSVGENLGKIIELSRLKTK